MSEDNSKMDPKTANTFGHDTHQPYARRSIRSVVFLVLVLCGACAFVGWYLFGTSSDGNKQDRTIAENSQQMPQNPYDENTGRSGVYNFFYKMFGGVEEGLEDSPHNLSNSEQLVDDYNPDGGMDDMISASIAIENYAEQRSARLQALKEDGYRHSVFDVVGSEVYDRKGVKAGAIFDVLVNKSTGKARAVVVKEDESRYERDLTTIRFKKIVKQQESGEVLLTVTEEKVEEKPDYNYSSLEDKNYISLRLLRGGQLLDFENKVAGQIDAIIYENAEAQNTYFTLRPVLAQQGISKFYLPFEDTNIVENPDGLDIRLTKEQTKALSKALFEDQ